MKAGFVCIEVIFMRLGSACAKGGVEGVASYGGGRRSPLLEKAGTPWISAPFTYSMDVRSLRPISFFRLCLQNEHNMTSK